MSGPAPRTILPLAVAALMALGASGDVLAAEGIAVSSVDNTSLSLVSRIGAVDNVMAAMDARIDRAIRSLPEGHPPAPILEALTSTQVSLDGLISTIDSRLCSQDGVIGTGDASLADGDIYAGDVTSNGLINQLSSIRRVVGEANGRLVRISGAMPPGPSTFELDAALTAVRNTTVAGYDAIALRVGTTSHPQSPCHSS